MVRRAYLTIALIAAPLVGVAGVRDPVLAAALQDQAESPEVLYRAAREALNKADYRRAAGLYRTLADLHPASSYAADALYWHAFSLYRLGGEDNLRTALAALDEQALRYPEAATAGDARSLAVRIRGSLALLGDPEAAARIAERAAEIAERQAERQAELAERQAELIERQAERAAELAERQAEQDAERIERQTEQEAERIEREAEAEAERIEREAEREAERIEREEDRDCPDEESDMRIAALHALHRLDPERALPILRQTLELRDPCAVPLRRMAIFVIADQDSPEAFDLLLSVAREDPDPEVRAEAVHWLGEVDDARAVAALRDILERSTDPEVRENAIYALSEHEGPEAARVLREFAARADQPDELRQGAIYYLAEAEHVTGALEFLIDLFQETASEGLKETILYTVGELEQEGGGAWLMEVALDPRQPMEIRKKALYYAAESEEASIDRLIALYDRTNDREFKEQLIYAYSQRDEPAATDKLIVIARTEPDLELRKQAILWLSESDDPRVEEILREIIAP